MKKLEKRIPTVPTFYEHNTNGKIAVHADERIILLTIQTSFMYVESSEGKCNIKTTDNQV